MTKRADKLQGMKSVNKVQEKPTVVPPEAKVPKTTTSSKKRRAGRKGGNR